MRLNRLRLRRSDGQVYLDRWGFEAKKIGGIFLHRMSAPDPGVDLHTHPWHFWSLILRGGYDEERATNRMAQKHAQWAEEHLPIILRRGLLRVRAPWTIKHMGRHECHRIVELHKRTSWSLIVHGPSHGAWGFWTPAGFVDHNVYGAERRDMVSIRG